MSIVSLNDKSTRKIKSSNRTKTPRWIRNSEWLSLSIVEDDEKCQALLAIYPSGDPNYISLAATVTSGTVNIDWGDGTNSNGTASTVQANKIYDYASVSGSPTSEGFKQVIITITPSVSGALQYVDFNKKHPSETGSYGAHNLLEIKASGPNFLRFLYFGGASTTGTAGSVLYPKLENVEVLSGQLYNDNQNYMFNGSCQRLKRYYFKSRTDMAAGVGGTENWTWTFAGCFSLISFEIKSPNGGKFKPYLLNQTFSNCYDLVNIPYLDFSGLTGYSGSNSVFVNCFSLEYVNPLTISLSSQTGTIFNNCHKLKELKLINNVSNWDYTLASQCYGLEYVEIINNAATSAIITITSCPNIHTIDIYSNNSTNKFPILNGLQNLRVLNCYGSGNNTILTTLSALNGLEQINGSFTTNSCTSIGSVFNNAKLKILPNINYSNVTSGTITFSSDYLESIPGTFNNATGVAVTFNSCRLLKEIPAFNITTFTNTAGNLPNLTSFLAYGMNANFTLANSKLSQSSLETIFEGLLKPAATRTFTLSANPGAGTAVSKTGTTTIGSTTVTMADTAGLTTGMQVLATGVSTARSVTFTDTGDTVTFAGHGIPNSTRVSFATITTTTGIATYTMYYVINATTDTFQLSATDGGSVLPLTTNGSGTMLLLTTITAVNPNVSITLSVPAFANGSVSHTCRNLKTQIAVMKNWTITG